MGTNYYKEPLKEKYDEECDLNYFTDEYKSHIGKRSAAGYYCWDCKTTLKIGGEAKVHYDGEWYDECPKCGASKHVETLDDSSAGRELGFNKSNTSKHNGVRTVSSFNWAIDPETLDSVLNEKTYNEYGDDFTKEEFKNLISDCPIHFTRSIGKEFS